MIASTPPDRFAVTVDDGEPFTQTFTGHDPATGQQCWQVYTVGSAEPDAYVVLRAGAAQPDGAEVQIDNPYALRNLASVLLARARDLEIHDAGADSGQRDVEALIAAWEEWGDDSVDLMGGLVAAHREVTTRMAMMAQDLQEALRGDARMADVWQIEDPTSDDAARDLADVLRVPPADLPAVLQRWATTTPA